MTIENTVHPCHTTEIVKLNRAIGQLEGIKRMIDDNRYCVDLLTQLKAVRSAIKRIELNVLQTHMKNCLTEACQSGSNTNVDKKIDELINLLGKYVG
ncbi:metal-sensitive transcriptional regulator [Thiotrichales bacterium 19S3-7]|nr:metal-sensitive transcriptional regulator [Thiotrichales bacterium 19S3-7]MCF6803017.1 metal-sensitive transcriptional regulator [Thiotrichales bacterium 19S3-11]